MLSILFLIIDNICNIILTMPLAIVYHFYNYIHHHHAQNSLYLWNVRCIRNRPLPWPIGGGRARPWFGVGRSRWGSAHLGMVVSPTAHSQVRDAAHLTKRRRDRVDRAPIDRNASKWTMSSLLCMLPKRFFSSSIAPFRVNLYTWISSFGLRVRNCATTTMSYSMNCKFLIKILPTGKTA